MNDLILKLVKKEKITKEDIEQGLYEICDNIHSSCSPECPICELVLTQVEKEEHNCKYFRNGKLMYEALKKV
jgi:hypothetical protein